ncbi:MAG: hypothetical protein CL398_02075 [Acidiferrobacteraceae bacterium]|nr:hypothetical protein [Acidiferrobacteraceae bacterium]
MLHQLTPGVVCSLFSMLTKHYIKPAQQDIITGPRNLQVLALHQLSVACEIEILDLIFSY